MLSDLGKDIEEMAKIGLSAGTMADNFAIKGVMVSPREINKFILKNNLFRPIKIRKAKRQIKQTVGKDCFYIRQIYSI